MTGSAREEAERLVAAVLARASAGQSAGDGFGHLGESVMGLLAGAAAGSWSTGSAECCACPVCKAIAAVRDPGPQTAERLATSAGDLASGVAGLMRAFSSLTAERPRPATPRTRPAPTPDQAWAAATRTTQEPAPVAPDERSDPWGAASAADARLAEAEAREARARAVVAEQERARAAAAAARARAAAAEQAVARAVERAQAIRDGVTSGIGGTPTGAAGSSRGDVWAMATADDDPPHRSVDHELGASAPEDRDPGTGDGARPGSAV